MDSARMARSTVAASGPSCGAGKVKVAAGPVVLVPPGRPDPTQHNYVFGQPVGPGTFWPARFLPII